MLILLCLPRLDRLENDFLNFLNAAGSNWLQIWTERGKEEGR